MCKGFQQDERERLRIKAFNAHLVSSSSSPNHTDNKLPDLLTLHYLPRINGRNILEINGSTIRPDSPAFVTLHRVLSSDFSTSSGESEEDHGKTRLITTTYVSRESVVASEGVRFEIYVGEVRMIKGVFRKLECGSGEYWEMGCKWEDVVEGVKTVEVAVEACEAVVLEKVVAEERRRRRRRWGHVELEEIPEEKEEGSDVVNDHVATCTCTCRGSEDDDGIHEEEDDEMVEMMMMDMDGVRWAVDVGIWVACLGVGYLVARASSSSKRILRRRLFM